jgi:hypothetical protein
MNKYQKTLDELCKTCAYSPECGDGCCDLVFRGGRCEEYNILKELVEKATPKKPNIHGFRECREVNTISFTCPICNKHIGRDNFCEHCGQRLSWSESEE